MMGKLFKKFEVFLKAIAHLLRADFQGLLRDENFLDKLTVSHISSFLQSGGFWLEWGLGGRFLGEHILEGSNNLDEGFCESFKFGHSM